MFTHYPWNEFFILWGLALLGSVLVLPYAMSLNPGAMEKVKLPLPVLLAISVLQSAVLFGLVTCFGLVAARALGLGAPFIEAALRGQPDWSGLVRLLPVAVGIGALTGAVLIALETGIFIKRLPEAMLKMTPKVGPFKGFLASFYGGIDEEILMRLFVFSGLAWLLGRFWQTGDGLPAAGAFWTANVLATLLFGLGHLPATVAITPLTPFIVTRALVLNGVAGIVFGFLYWKFGLEVAMIAHFSADIVLHVVGPVLWKDKLAPQGVGGEQAEAGALGVPLTPPLSQGER